MVYIFFKFQCYAVTYKMSLEVMLSQTGLKKFIKKKKQSREGLWLPIASGLLDVIQFCVGYSSMFDANSLAWTIFS